MNIKSRVLLLTAMSVCTTFIYAQEPTAQKVEGTPYLNDSYVEGEIYFGETGLTKAPVRYNIYKDYVEYQQNGKALALDPSQKIKKIQMGEETFIVEKVVIDGKPKFGFVSLLDSGRVTLFSKKRIRYQAPLKGRASDDGDLPARYSRLADAYFYKIGTGELKELNNMKDLIANLPDKQDELKQYAKKEKINAKKENELRQLIRYYNSL